MKNKAGIVGYRGRVSLMNDGRDVHSATAFVEFDAQDTEGSIPARFEQQARRHPTRVAVKTRDGALTYDRLNRAANRIARAILARRGQCDAPVALLFDKGAPMIAAMLGVLKAGKFHVPLDPSLPLARLTGMVQDSQAALLIADVQHVSLAHRVCIDGCLVINVDEIDPGVSEENLNLSVSPDALSWIIFTSGSTGRPKGVVQNHRNVLHNVLNHTNVLRICADDRSTLLASCATVQAMTDIYCTLLNGATLYPVDIRADGLAGLASWMIQEEITMYRSSASVFRYFVGTLTGTEVFSKLRLIKVGSEPVSKTDVELYKKYFPDECVLVNALASTEVGTFRMHLVTKETVIDGTVVPVGYPLDGMEVLLLDDAGQEIGADQIGHIAVKSRYLSPGYWRQPELTGTVFRPTPGSDIERIYHTGDLGRLRPDGCLEYMGRKDHQIKIRGYRVEVGEIESALLDFAAITNAVVVAREDPSVGRRLIAYIVTAGQCEFQIPTLRHHLMERLPDYMMPSAFVVVEAFPLTPNGKVDRQALPAPEQAGRRIDATVSVPRTPIEVALAEIWSEVLGVDRISRDDSFFELGGHSLMATQVISKIREVFCVELPFVSLFEAPTIGGLAVTVLKTLTEQTDRHTLARLLGEIEQLSEQNVQAKLEELI